MEVTSLQAQGCSAQDWDQIEVPEGFNPASVFNCQFSGPIRLGLFIEKVRSSSGLEKPSGLYNAVLSNCTVGDNTRIAHIGLHLAGYDIESGVCIENVALMQTNPGATFGNGIEVSVLNEGGGREIVLFDKLSAQFAYLMCLHRHRPKVIERLNAIAAEYVQSVQSDQGRVGRGAIICSTNEIIDVNVGPFATINNVGSLRNGTILSTEETPSVIGTNVIAENFIVAEGSSVTDGVILEKVFVGQGCRMGRQYSAENSVFFANCEAFHGEACSVFAGPYTVTHHKSTLLIGGLYSFYNAGSGTNASNHMYKLGPVHEGKLLRGVKTGSFSYMMWPCRVGPFSVVLGKHSGTFDTSEFPFSHLEARSDGKCSMTPGLHLTTVGTVRDGAKWPKRDRRKGLEKRDVISFDVFSPYTVGKMIRARNLLKELQGSTEKSIEEVSIHGALVKRLMLRASQKYYRSGIELYLLEQVVRRLELTENLCVPPDAVYSEEWVDIAGQLMPRQRLVNLQEALETGEVANLQDFFDAIDEIRDHYQDDEWAWSKKAYELVFGMDPTELTNEGLREVAQQLLKVKTKFLTLVKADAEKEFSESSRLGFGQDGDADDLDRDFDQVRGTYEDNSFVQDMNDSIEQLKQRIEKLEAVILRRRHAEPVSPSMKGMSS